MNSNSSTPAQRSVGFASEADMLVPVTASARLFLSRHRRQREFNVFYELQVGHVTSGRLTVRYGDREEVIEPGDAFYMPPGHVPAAVAGTQLVMFSPQAELAAVEAAMRELMMQKGNGN
jgi:mannose-6-phosphate isomerase-like protein (cupin superfamily)